MELKLNPTGLSSYKSSLFGDASDEDTVLLNIDELDEFTNHPFKVIYDSALDTLTESIEHNGVLTPLLVRKKDDRYEIISGHRRRAAAVRAGLSTVPVKILALSDDEAAVAMVDSNMQRESFLPSERVYSMKIKYDALMRMHKIDEAMKSQRSRDVLGEMMGMSGRQVTRYLSLTHLLRGLMDMLDHKRFNLSIAYLLAELDETAQTAVFSYLRDDDRAKLTPALIAEIKNNGASSADDIRNIASSSARQQTERIYLPEDLKEKYFSGMSTKEASDKLTKILTEYFRYH